MTKENYNDMPITKILKKWMTSEGWKDEIDVADDRKTAQVATSFRLNDQVYKMFLDIDEDSEWFSVFMYSPFNVPVARVPEMVRILNNLNLENQKVGRLACLDGDEPGPIQFRWTADFSDSSISEGQIAYMVQAPVDFFSFFGEVLASIALTKISPEKLMSDFWAEKNQEAAERPDQDPPAEL